MHLNNNSSNAKGIKIPYILIGGPPITLEWCKKVLSYLPSPIFSQLIRVKPIVRLFIEKPFSEIKICI